MTVPYRLISLQLLNIGDQQDHLQQFVDALLLKADT